MQDKFDEAIKNINCAIGILDKLENKKMELDKDYLVNLSNFMSKEENNGN